MTQADFAATCTDLSASIATEIFHQLGGVMFAQVTGASVFMPLAGNKNGLTFTLPDNFAINNINRVDIELTPDDTYHMRFYWVSGFSDEPELIESDDDCYCDTLASTFKHYTGLDTIYPSLSRL